MDPSLFTISNHDPLWIVVAFLFGVGVKQIRLPPMVGFLIAGFVLHFLGAESSDLLQEIADLGVTLLLFTIGLKLRPLTLLRPEVLATALLNMTVSIGVALGLIAAVAGMGLSLFAGLDLTSMAIIAFALSFSSTVFVVKILEERGAVTSRYGRVAIGILVIQDIAAVGFLAISSGKIPTIWALGLFALIPARPLFGKLLSLTDHKELLSVFGFAAALGGAALFEVVGLKGQLGALIFGALLAYHPKASELSKDLLTFKDVFLVCFFLTIGLSGLPTWETAGAAAILMMVLPIKGALFVFLMLRFRLRGRAAVLDGAALSNFSEFGLIVAVLAMSLGQLSAEWLTVIALAVSVSFVLSSILNAFADRLYERYRDAIDRWQTVNRLPGDETISLAGARVLIFGMGRVGRAAYREMESHYEGGVFGVDQDEAAVERNRQAGRNVVQGDATHPEFWLRLDRDGAEIDMILLAMATVNANIDAAERLRAAQYKGPIVATTLFADQEEELLRHGVDAVFNVYAEAGAGAASKMWDALKPNSTA